MARREDGRCCWPGRQLRRRCWGTQIDAKHGQSLAPVLEHNFCQKDFAKFRNDQNVPMVSVADDAGTLGRFDFLYDGAQIIPWGQPLPES